jgi:hypothetical protein
VQQYHTREAIRVAVIFGPNGRIQPVWFEWRRRKHTVLSTTYCYEGRRGESRLLHFTVTGEGGLFELTYNTQDQTWQLQGIEVE